MRKESQRRQGSRIILWGVALFLGSLFLLGGCGGGSGNRPMSSVQGRVFGFSDDIVAGRVVLRALSGEILPEGEGTVCATGLFVISRSYDLPQRFLVEVSDMQIGAAVSRPRFPIPEKVLALAEGATSDTLLRVTPLSSFVASYALQTGKGMDAAEKDVRIFLGLPDGIRLSALMPHPSKRMLFSFLTFEEAWRRSGLPFMAFLDGLVAEVRVGKSRPFPPDDPDEGMGSVFSWILEQIAAGAVGEVGGQGIGWIMNLINGSDPMDEIRGKLDRMAQKLDQIYNELISFEIRLEDLLRQMSMENDYNAMLRPISDIRSLYDDMLMKLPKIEDRQLARSEAAKIDNKITDILSGLDTLQEKLANPNVGTSFYTKVAEYFVQRVHHGGMSLGEAVNQYVKIFVFLTGIQIKGLALVSEHYHLSKSPKDIERIVLEWHRKHIDRLSAQGESFLNGMEKLGALCAPGAGCTLDYHRGSMFPSDGNGSLYAVPDAVVGDAVGSTSQVVVRLFWDPKVRDVYPGLRGKPLDYSRYFSCLRERMAQLARRDGAGRGEVLGMLLVGPSTVKTAVHPKGTVNLFGNQFPGESATETAVLRYIFRGVDWKIPFTLMPDAAQVMPFDLKPEEIYVPGTVGKKLLHSAAETPTIRVVVASEDRFATIPLLAWLPETLILNNGCPDELLGGGTIPVGDFVSLKSTNAQFARMGGLGRVECLGDRGGMESRLAFAESRSYPDRKFHVFGDASGFSETQTNERMAMNFREGPVAFRRYAGDDSLAFFESPPTVVERFIDPEKRGMALRKGIPLFLRIKTEATYLREASQGGEVWSNGREKDASQRWIFFDGQGE